MGVNDFVCPVSKLYTLQGARRLLSPIPPSLSHTRHTTSGRRHEGRRPSLSQLPPDRDGRNGLLPGQVPPVRETSSGGIGIKRRPTTARAPPAEDANAETAAIATAATSAATTPVSAAPGSAATVSQPPSTAADAPATTAASPRNAEVLRRFESLNT